MEEYAQKMEEYRSAQQQRKAWKKAQVCKQPGTELTWGTGRLWVEAP